jgi:hypothetical protein
LAEWLPRRVAGLLRHRFPIRPALADPLLDLVNRDRTVLFAVRSEDFKHDSHLAGAGRFGKV